MRGRGLDQVCQMLIRHGIDALISIDPHPLDGVATGETPNHHVPVFNAMLADLVSVGDVDGILCTVWIEVCPVGGLNSEGHLVCFFVALIIRAWDSDPRPNRDSLLAVLKTGSAGME